MSSATNCGCLICSPNSQITTNRTCQACNTLNYFCITCFNSICTACDSRAGLNLSNICVYCMTFMVGCATCNLAITPNNCTSCYGGYFYNTSLLQCELCSIYIYQCVLCVNSSTCTRCNVTFGFNSSHDCDPCKNYITNC
jgi:hypothetical protein